MQIFTGKKIYNFMKLRFAALALSLLLVAASLAAWALQGFSYGIDFSGGTLVQLRYEAAAAPLDAIRERLAADERYRGASVTEFGAPNEIVVRFGSSSDALGHDVGTELAAHLASTGSFEVRRVDVVGPKVGGELREKGLMAVLISFVLILLYIAARFEWRFACAAIISELHDIFIVVGAIVLLRIDVNLDTLAAILTVLGYSLNDTIIIFDRIREKIATSGASDMGEIINESVSATLSRTTLTSGTTLFTVLILYAFGGDMISDFSLVLIVGVIAGTLSSIFVASPLLIWLRFSVADYRAKLAEKAARAAAKERERAMYEKGRI